MLFQNMPETKDRGFIRPRRAAQVHARKVPVGGRGMEIEYRGHELSWKQIASRPTPALEAATLVLRSKNKAWFLPRHYPWKNYAPAAERAAERTQLRQQHEEQRPTKKGHFNRVKKGYIFKDF